MIHPPEPSLSQTAARAKPGRFIQSHSLGLNPSNEEKHRFSLPHFDNGTVFVVYFLQCTTIFDGWLQSNESEQHAICGK